MKMGNLERTTYVRNKITMATLDLLKEKEMKDITISTITELAQVSRVSFYRNYDTKEDIIKTYIGKILVDWQMNSPEVKRKEETGDDNEMLGSLFGLLKEHSELFLLLSNRSLLYLLRDTLKDIYGPKPEYPNFGAYFAAFIFYGIYGWIEEWVARGMEESAEEMTKLLQERNLTL